MYMCMGGLRIDLAKLLDSTSETRMIPSYRALPACMFKGGVQSWPLGKVWSDQASAKKVRKLGSKMGRKIVKRLGRFRNIVIGLSRPNSCDMKELHRNSWCGRKLRDTPESNPPLSAIEFETLLTPEG